MFDKEDDVNILALSSYRSADPLLSCASTVVHIFMSCDQHDTHMSAPVITAPNLSTAFLLLIPFLALHFIALHCATLYSGPLLVQKCSLNGVSSFASASLVL